MSKLYEDLLKHPDFVNVCHKIRQQSNQIKEISYSTIKEELHQFIEKHSPQIDSRTSEDLFKKLYLTLMRVVSAHPSQPEQIIDALLSSSKTPSPKTTITPDDSSSSQQQTNSLFTLPAQSSSEEEHPLFTPSQKVTTFSQSSSFRAAQYFSSSSSATSFSSSSHPSFSSEKETSLIIDGDEILYSPSVPPPDAERSPLNAALEQVKDLLPPQVDSNHSDEKLASIDFNTNEELPISNDEALEFLDNVASQTDDDLSAVKEKEEEVVLRNALSGADEASTNDDLSAVKEKEEDSFVSRKQEVFSSQEIGFSVSVETQTDDDLLAFSEEESVNSDSSSSLLSKESQKVAVSFDLLEADEGRREEEELAEEERESFETRTNDEMQRVEEDIFDEGLSTSEEDLEAKLNHTAEDWDSVSHQLPDDDDEPKVHGTAMDSGLSDNSNFAVAEARDLDRPSPYAFSVAEQASLLSVSREDLELIISRERLNEVAQESEEIEEKEVLISSVEQAHDEDGKVESFLFDPEHPEKSLDFPNKPERKTRFQTITFESGFYLLNQETGESWFIRAGTNKFIPCEFEPASPPTSLSSIPPALQETFEEKKEYYPPLQNMLNEPEEEPFRVHSFEDPLTPYHREDSYLHIIADTAQKNFSFSPEASFGEDDYSLEGFLLQEPYGIHEGEEFGGQFYRDSQFQELATQLLKDYPYPIAHILDAMLVESDSKLRIQLLLSLFTITLKYMAFPVIIQYLKMDSKNDLQTLRVLKNLQTPDLQTWVDFLDIAEDLFVVAPPSFIREILRAFRAFRSEPVTNFGRKIIKYFEQLEKYTNFQYHSLNFIDSFIQYRNFFLHERANSPSRIEINRALEIFEPLMLDMLDRMDWMKKYPLLYSYQEGSMGNYLAYPIMGNIPKSAETLIINTQESLSISNPIFIGDPSDPDNYLSLYPLLITSLPLRDDSPVPSQERALFFFHASTGHRLIYHNIWNYLYFPTDTIATWRKMIYGKFYPSQEVESLGELRRNIKFWTEQVVDNFVTSHRYLPQYTLIRNEFKQILLNYYASKSKALLLLGSSGVGKTTTLISEALYRNRPVIFLQGTDLLGSSILNTLNRILGGAPVNFLLSFEEFAQRFSLLSQLSEPLLIFFDNLEFHNDLVSLFIQLDQFIHQLEKSSLADSIKIIISLRNDTYWRYRQTGKLFPESYRSFFQLENSKAILRDLTPFLEITTFQTEEAEALFRKYEPDSNISYQMFSSDKSRWHKIPNSARTKTLLRHPLLLKLAMQIFTFENIPHNLTVRTLMEKYFEFIEEKHSLLPFPERIKFIKIFIQKFMEKDAYFLYKEELFDFATNYSYLLQIQKEFEDTSLHSIYLQLQKFGLLFEEYTPEHCIIAFSSKMLFSYLYTQAWIEQYLDRTFLEQLEIALSYPSSLEFLYFFLWLNILEQKEAPLFVNWLLDHYEEVRPYAQEFLLELCRLDDPVCFDLMKALLFKADESLLVDILQVYDKLFRSEYEEAAANILSAIFEAIPFEQIPDPLKGELLLRKARILEIQGNMEAALKNYQRCQNEVTERNNLRLLSQVYLRLAQLYQARDEYIFAQQIIEEAKTILTEKQAPPTFLSRILREQGSLYFKENEFDKALEIYEQSLKLEEESHNPRGISTSLCSLGAVLGSQNQYDKALEYYHKCLNIRQELGDRRSIATTLNNIGIIYKNQGQLEKSFQYFQDALNIREELGLYKDLINSHDNLAIFFREQGEISKALQHQQISYSLKEKINNRRELAASLHQIGELLYLQDNFKDAFESYIKASEFYEEENDFFGKSLVKNSLGELLEAQGNFDEALEFYTQTEEFFEKENNLLELIPTLRHIARIKAHQGELDNALLSLNKALNFAEKMQLKQEIIFCMLDLAQIRLMKDDLPPTRAYIDRTLALIEEWETKQNNRENLLLISSRKNALCLTVRVAVRVQDCLEVEENLSQLEITLDSLHFDPDPNQTIVTFYEAAQFYQDLDHARALELCSIAIKRITPRFFPQRKALERLYRYLQQTPHTPHPEQAI